MPVFIYITYNEPPGSVWVRRDAFEIVLQQHTGPIQLELCSRSSPRSGPDARGSESTRPGPDAQCPQTRGAECSTSGPSSRGTPSDTPCARPRSRDAAAICSHAASAPQLRTHVSVIPLYPIQTNLKPTVRKYLTTISSCVLSTFAHLLLTYCVRWRVVPTTVNRQSVVEDPPTAELSWETNALVAEEEQTSGSAALAVSLTLGVVSVLCALFV